MELSSAVQVEEQAHGPSFRDRAQDSGLLKRVLRQERLEVKDVDLMLREMPLKVGGYIIKTIPTEEGEVSLDILTIFPEGSEIGHAILLTIKKDTQISYFVELFDSECQPVSDYVINKLKQMLPAGSHVHVYPVPVQSQGFTNDTDCAIFAFTFLAHLCLGLRGELETVLFDASRLREHLYECCVTECFTTGQFSEFPTIKENGQKLIDTGRKQLDDVTFQVE